MKGSSVREASKKIMDLLIKNARVFDGFSLRQGTWNVAISDEKIVDVFTGDGEDRRAIREIDAAGKLLLPGLIDLHVHLTWDGGLDPATTIEQSSPEKIFTDTVSSTLKYLEKGITSVRDLGSTNDAAIHIGKAVDSGKLPGPRIFSSGRSIIMTGGHDPFHGIMIDGPWEALKAVRLQAFVGARVIKISATGGVYGRATGEGVEDIELRPEEIQMIVNEAHRRHLPVTAHAIGEAGISNCVEAGIDCIEHGHYITPSLAQEMSKKDISYVPTLAVYKHLAEDPEIPEYAREKSKKIIERQMQAFQWAQKAGVRIGAGSDTGSAKMPHPSLLRELIALNKAGLGIEEVIKTATSEAAKILKMEGRLGVIRPGALADCVLVGGTPWVKLDDMDKIFCVIKGGSLFYKRED